MLDHTEGVLLSSIRLPYLRRNMPFSNPSSSSKDAGASSEDLGEIKNFVVPMYNEDGLVIRISPNNYHILYDPYTSDWWIQSTSFRKRGLSAYEEVKERRRRGLKNLFENKERNEWMKGKEEREIEGTKGRFESWIRDGPQTLEGGERSAVSKEHGEADAIMSGT